VGGLSEPKSAPGLTVRQTPQRAALISRVRQTLNTCKCDVCGIGRLTCRCRVPSRDAASAAAAAAINDTDANRLSSKFDKRTICRPVHTTPPNSVHPRLVTSLFATIEAAYTFCRHPAHNRCRQRTRDEGRT